MSNQNTTQNKLENLENTIKPLLNSFGEDAAGLAEAADKAIFAEFPDAEYVDGYGEASTWILNGTQVEIDENFNVYTSE